MMPTAVRVRFEATIPQPFDRVEQALLEGPKGWLPGLLEEAGAAATAELLLHSNLGELSREVSIRTGSPARLEGRVSIPIEWEAAANPELFPTLRGRLKAIRASRDATELELIATYAPPGGEAGLLVDGVLLHRVAESTLADFLARVAGVVERNAWSQAVALHPVSVAGPND
jgi:hypothetical protein